MKRLWQNLAKCIGLALCVTLVCFNSGEQMSYVRGLSNSVSTDQLENICRSLSEPLSLSMGDRGAYVSENLSETLSGKSGSASIRLFGAIPIKTIEYGERQDITVMPGGMPIGVSIYRRGAGGGPGQHIRNCANMPGGVCRHKGRRRHNCGQRRDCAEFAASERALL